jgi:endonuclease/exonuclease/phosphatase (EEP) superfamily protein YafD
LAGNIETQQNIFGVLTATKSAFREMHRSLSTKKELGFMSHKSFLLSRHTLANNKELTILNLHAINFVSSKTFAYELENIEKILLEIDGPLIVAGDFNTWSKKRHKLLENFQLELGLKKLQINDEKHIKQIFWQRLDHIYYRELKPLQALALDTKNISDHNPIYAEFELL